MHGPSHGRMRDHLNPRDHTFAEVKPAFQAIIQVVSAFMCAESMILGPVSIRVGCLGFSMQECVPRKHKMMGASHSMTHTCEST